MVAEARTGDAGATSGAVGAWRAFGSAVAVGATAPTTTAVTAGIASTARRILLVPVTTEW
jgi:hypothetical protein